MSERCEKCYKTVEGRVKFFKDKAYHPDCFCCRTCLKELSGTIREHEGNVYCETCYGHFKADRCAGCYHPLTETGVEFIVLDGDKYHQRCFRCKKCNKSLEHERAIKSRLGIVCDFCSKH